MGKAKQIKIWRREYRRMVRERYKNFLELVGDLKWRERLGLAWKILWLRKKKVVE